MLSRQALPMLRDCYTRKNRSERGAYVLREVIGPRDLTIMATGSEVQIAKAAAEELFAGPWGSRGCRLHAVLGAVRGAERRLPQRNSW